MNRRHRRLSAILAADIAGYTRLMQYDESGTLEWWWNSRASVIDPAIAKHGGRIVKHTGDGFLAEFLAATDAVHCAINLQRALAPTQRDRASDRQILFRIGVNVGEVIADSEDVYGNVVNLAARIESLATPGGVAVSAAVYEQVVSQLEVDFGPPEQHRVKNIDPAITIRRLVLDDTLPKAPATAPPQLPRAKPSIAVLPFVNRSNDPEQAFFADGMTEDIVTALSKYRWFHIISRNSTLNYASGAIDVRQIGRDLDVRYVLQGSVRTAGPRVRITAQLTEAETGNHIWGEQYDRKLEDVFALQDEMTQTIVTAVAPELQELEFEHVRHKPTEDLRAWDLFQRGVQAFRSYDRVGMESCSALMRQAISLDPAFSQPHGYLALVAFSELSWGWARDRETHLRYGIECAQTAIRLDRRDYFAHVALGRLLLAKGDIDGALHELEAAVDLNPNYAYSYFGLAAVHAHRAKWDSVLDNAVLAQKLSPADTLAWGFCNYEGIGHFGLGDFARAARCFELAQHHSDAQWVTPMYLAAACVQVGDLDSARHALARVVELEGRVTISMTEAAVNFHAPPLAGQILEGLRKLGVDE